VKKKPKTAMVLAAGLGVRLRPLTLTCPKPLLPIVGEPILHIALRSLKREGFSKVVINLHHLGHMIKESVGDGSAFGLEVFYSEEDKILGTGGGIKAAQHLLGADTFMVINSDIITDAPFAEIWDYHLKMGGVATLVVKDDPSLTGWGAIKIDENGRLRQILGKPGYRGALKSSLFTGIQVLEPIFFDFLEPGKKASSTQDVYPVMLEKGYAIYCFEYFGRFVDIGISEGYEKAKNT